MIYVTGDTHALIDFKKIMAFADSEKGHRLKKDDYLIVCGDFGLLWNYEVTGRSIDSNPKDAAWTERELYMKEILDGLPFTTLFVDGNHENFNRLNGYPITGWRGGKVHKISASIIHLMRGQIYEIEGKKLFTFGGAASTDRGPATGTRFLDEGFCWWPEELSSQAERDEALVNLRKHGNKVDYVITHCISERQALRMGFIDANMQTAFFTSLEDTVKYRAWFCGHYHRDEWINGNTRVLYREIVPIDTPVPYENEEG